MLNMEPHNQDPRFDGDITYYYNPPPGDGSCRRRWIIYVNGIQTPAQAVHANADTLVRITEGVVVNVFKQKTGEGNSYDGYIRLVEASNLFDGLWMGGQSITVHPPQPDSGPAQQVLGCLQS